MSEEENIIINKDTVWKYSAFLLVGVVLLGGFFMFAGNGNSVTKSNSVNVGGGPGELVEVKTAIQRFQYNPDEITVKEGSRVRLTIENKDNVVHGLHLPQFGIVDSQPALGTKTVEFIAKEGSTNGKATPTCSVEHGETLTFNVV